MMYRTIKEVRKYILIFREYLGNKMYFVYFLGALASLFEGIGLVMFLPLLDNIDQSNTSNTELQIFLKNLLNSLGLGDSILSILLLISLIFLIKGLIVFISLGYNAFLTGKLLSEIKKRLFNVYSKMSYSYYTQKNTGHLINLNNEQPSKVLIAFRKLTTFISNLINTCILLLIGFSISISFGFISLIVGLAIILIFLSVNKYVRKLSLISASEDGNLNKWLIQTLQSFKYLVSTNQVYKLKEHVINSIKILSTNLFRSGLAAAFTQSIREPFAVILIVCLIYVQVYLLGGRLEPLLVSLLLFYRALNSTLALQNAFQGTFEYIGSLELINQEFLDQSKNSSINTGNNKTNLKNSIVFNNVFFKYSNSNSYTLKSLNFSISARTSIGIIGSSGSGKTSIIDLITMLNLPSKGNIKVDGILLNDFQVKNWRNQIGYVSQDPIIFDDTIFNNISMRINKKNNKKIIQKVRDSARKANILDFIESLPKKFNTKVGDRGLMLSGGQKQKLMIARELFREPNLLILDEATSSLDSRSELEIQNSINSLMGSITIIIIAHRLSTLKKVDKILVLEKGTIVETGRFNDLKLNNNSKFSQLSKIQNIK